MMTLAHRYEDRLYRDLEAGDVFRSPRASEGLVTVVCPPGTCRHDERDRFSTHVRSDAFRTEFFVLADPGSDNREVWAGDTVEVLVPKERS